MKETSSYTDTKRLYVTTRVRNGLIWDGSGVKRLSASFIHHLLGVFHTTQWDVGDSCTELRFILTLSLLCSILCYTISVGCIQIPTVIFYLLTFSSFLLCFSRLCSKALFRFILPAFKCLFHYCSSLGSKTPSGNTFLPLASRIVTANIPTTQLWNLTFFSELYFPRSALHHK